MVSEFPPNQDCFAGREPALEQAIAMCAEPPMNSGKLSFEKGEVYDLRFPSTSRYAGGRRQRA